MDSVLSEAAQALSRFDPLAALGRVALRKDAPALALRGIALAQLGEFQSARRLLDRAAKSFGMARPTQRARCLAASAEVLLACRDSQAALRQLRAALSLFETSKDIENTAFTRLQLARVLLMGGKLDAARANLEAIELSRVSAARKALFHLVHADIAMRESQVGDARAALRSAYRAARSARILPLLSEIDGAAQSLDANLARVVIDGRERGVTRLELASLYRSNQLLIDACRKSIAKRGDVVELRSRPVLFALLLTLARKHPGEATREELLAEAFEMRRPNESLRARLRVELARLRQKLGSLAAIEATSGGFRLVSKARLALVLPLKTDENSALLTLLGDNQAWPTSALATALGISQRGVQRRLNELERQGSVRALGAGRSQRWRLSLASDSATTLLLLGAPQLR